MSKQLCQSVYDFIAARSGGRRASQRLIAACTGQDNAALQSFVHLVDLYTRADAPSRPLVFLALQCTLRTMQPHTQPLAQHALVHAYDYIEADRLWSKLTRDSNTLLGDMMHGEHCLKGPCTGDTACPCLCAGCVRAVRLEQPT